MRHVVVALSLMACTTAASAQMHSTGDYLKRMDSDGDGRVSLLEYQDWLIYGFDAMDANRDGTLQPHEQPGGRGTPITRAQHRDTIAQRFRRQDANKDGFLSARELSAPPR